MGKELKIPAFQKGSAGCKSQLHGCLVMCSPELLPVKCHSDSTFLLELKGFTSRTGHK